MRLLTLAALAALLAAAFLALSTARAVPPPADVQLILGVDDEDGIVEPGQTVNVSAAIRFTGPYAQPERMVAEDIQLNSSLGWENAFGRTLEVDDQVVVGGEWLWALRDSGDNAWYERLPNRANVAIKAMHGRTAVARPQSNHGANQPSRDDRIYIFDLYNKRQALIIERPAGATQTFGTSQRLHPTDSGGNVGAGTISHTSANRYLDRNESGTAVAVWHETETKAWLFAGDPEAAVGAETWVGRLWIYSLEWPADQNSSAPPVATLHGYIAPPLSEAGNYYRGTANTTAHWASYGSSVAVSADGSTLAVGAPWMNITGAVYVYTRPDGPGQDWSDLAYADGVKVTPYPIPHWGTSEATGVAPFSSATNCDEDCRAARAGWGGFLGFRNIALSADGTVMTVGAPWKSFGAQTMGGGFSGSVQRAGEAYVFVAPNGDWDTAPDVVAGKTVMTAKSNAATAYPNYNKATHVSPGPNRRVTEAAVSFVRVAWPGWSFQYTGYRVAITLDGSTIAVGMAGSPNNNTNAGPRRIMIFQVDSPDEWANVQTDPWPTGTLIESLQGFGAPGWCGFDFNADGTLLMVGMCGAGAGNDQGEIRTIRRPADGTWDAGAIHVLAPDSLQFQPNPVGGRGGTSWGIVTWSIDRQRFAISSHDEKIIEHNCCNTQTEGPGTMTFSDAGCYERRENGVSTLTCPLRLPAGATAIFVPPGEHDGSALTISGRVKLSMDGHDAGSGNPSVYLFNNRDLENARTVTSQPLTLRIGAGGEDELAEAKLNLAERGGGTWPSSLSSGQRTVLRLQLLDENGKPARGADIASIIAVATRGSLSSNLLDSSDAQNSNGCLGGGGDSCQLNPALLSGADAQGALLARNYEQGRGLEPRTPADRGLAPGETLSYSAGNIRLTLEHTGTAGAAEVDVTVISKTGREFSAGPLTVILTGPPDSLSISAPATGLLNRGTPDSGADKDDRDILSLSVAAADKSGNRVDAPTNNLRARLTGPDGKRVTSGVELEWPLGGADNPTLDADGNRQVRVNINRAADEALANGEYTLEVRAGALTATQTFSVGGGPATVTLGELEGTLAQGEQVTLTATVLDADGNPVPNGTPVDWSATDIGTTAVLVQLSAAAGTRDGNASVTWLVLSDGATIVRAQAGDQVELRRLDVAAAMAAAAAEPPSPADGLHRPAPGLATWSGEGSTSAAALLDDLPGVDSILLWSNSENRWLRYARSNGRTVPGSVDFEVASGAVLWIAE